MSYILNALRKSERERQTVKPDTIAERIVIHHSPRQRASNLVIAALVLINVLVLAYFLGFSGKNLPDGDGKKHAASVESGVDPVEKVHTVVVNQSSWSLPSADDSKTVLATSIGQPNKKEDQKTPPIKVVKPVPVVSVTAIEKAKANNVEPAPKLVEQKVVVKPEPVKPSEGITAAERKKDKPEEIVPSQAADTRSENLARLPIKNDVPFLEEMPDDIQRSLPEMNINVFSYSEAPDDRFVMINMVKYVPGQRINDVMDFNEIRSNAIVVTYKGRTFKIRRP
ncbi:MAG: general secretion pathway protein GspB [Gammaproteobacteria bacterium]